METGQIICIIIVIIAHIAASYLFAQIAEEKGFSFTKHFIFNVLLPAIGIFAICILPDRNNAIRIDIGSIASDFDYVSVVDEDNNVIKDAYGNEARLL